MHEFGTALELVPSSAIVRIEYARGLFRMFAKARMAQADAMPRLDAALARAELAE